jgi:CubicO group peptidase (beta-lactamase class C family)
MQLQAEVDAVVKSSPGPPSLAIGLVYDQELIWTYGSGPVNRSDPSQGTVNEKTGFRIGSVSKVFTALMLRQLKEQGRVADMRDPIRKYEKRFRVKNSFQGEPTLEQLSAHTAGLPREMPCKDIYAYGQQGTPVGKVLHF